MNELLWIKTHQTDSFEDTVLQQSCFSEYNSCLGLIWPEHIVETYNKANK